jgi:MFS family permease
MLGTEAMIESDGGGRHGYARLVLVILVVVYGFNFMDRYIFIIMMESIKRDLRLSDTQLGLISGVAFSTVYSFAGLGIARWADFGIRRSIIALGLAAWSVGTGLCGLTRSFWQIFVARMGVGVAESACSPPAHSLLADYFPPSRRAFAFSIYASGLPIGLGLGFIAGGWIGDHWGWRTAFIAVAVPGLLFAPIVRLAVREPPRGASESRPVDSLHYSVGDAWRFIISRPSLLAYMSGAGLFSLGGTAVNNWGALYLIRIHGLSSTLVGLWSGILASTGVILGGIVAGLIADRLSRKDSRWNLWVAVVASLAGIPATLCFVNLGQGSLLWAAYFATSFCYAGSAAPTYAITQKLMPVRMRSLGPAILLLSYNLIGIAACNFLIGYLSDLWSQSLAARALSAAISLTQVATIAGAVCTIYAICRMPRDFGDQHLRVV